MHKGIRYRRGSRPVNSPFGSRDARYGAGAGGGSRASSGSASGMYFRKSHGRAFPYSSSVICLLSRGSSRALSLATKTHGSSTTPQPISPPAGLIAGLLDRHEMIVLSFHLHVQGRLANQGPVDEDIRPRRAAPTRMLIDIRNGRVRRAAR